MSTSPNSSWLWCGLQGFSQQIKKHHKPVLTCLCKNQKPQNKNGRAGNLSIYQGQLQQAAGCNFNYFHTSVIWTDHSECHSMVIHWQGQSGPFDCRKMKFSLAVDLVLTIGNDRETPKADFLSYHTICFIDMAVWSNRMGKCEPQMCFAKQYILELGLI